MDSSPFIFLVQLLEDNTDEPPEMFNLVLSSISEGVSIDTNSSIATVTIVDNDGKNNSGSAFPCMHVILHNLYVVLRHILYLDPPVEFQFSPRNINAFEDNPSFQVCVQVFSGQLFQPQVISLTLASGLGPMAATSECRKYKSSSLSILSSYSWC